MIGRYVESGREELGMDRARWEDLEDAKRGLHWRGRAVRNRLKMANDQTSKIYALKCSEEIVKIHPRFMCARFEIISARTIDTKEGFKKHVAYTILVKKDEHDNDPNPVVIERRYTDFLELYKALSQEFPEITSYVYFPRKVFLGNFASDLIKLRSKSFEKFLKLISINEKLRDSPTVKKFLIGKEEKQARKCLETKCYGQAKPLLENIFRILSKIHTDRHPAVIIALCRLTACCNADPISLVDAEKYAALALRRFEGISDVDLLCYYVPLLQLCIHLWWALGRDKEPLESRLNALKRRGHRVDGCPPLLESMLKID